MSIESLMYFIEYIFFANTISRQLVMETFI